MKEKERNHLFDNIKGLMLFLVIVGHTLDPYTGEGDTIYRVLMKYIYLFHMPMFAFITGYFTKNIEKARKNAVKKVLLPYVFWQMLYIIMAVLFIALGLTSFNEKVFKPSLLLPSSPLYYLISVFFWKVFAVDILKMKHPVIFSVVSGVLISMTENEGFHIGVGATFSLLIFFVLGLLCTKEHIEKIRTMPKLFGISIMLAGIIPAIYLPYSFRNVRFTYLSVGLTNTQGAAYRVLFYVIAVAMCVAIINLMPEKKTVLSKVGERSILVYAASSFAAPSLFLLIARFLPISGMTVINFICIILFATIIVGMASMDWILKIYEVIMNKIEILIFK